MEIYGSLFPVPVAIVTIIVLLFFVFPFGSFLARYVGPFSPYTNLFEEEKDCRAKRRALIRERVKKIKPHIFSFATVSRDQYYLGHPVYLDMANPGHVTSRRILESYSIRSGQTYLEAVGTVAFRQDFLAKNGGDYFLGGTPEENDHDDPRQVLSRVNVFVYPEPAAWFTKILEGEDA